MGDVRCRMFDGGFLTKEAWAEEEGNQTEMSLL